MLPTAAVIQLVNQQKAALARSTVGKNTINPLKCVTVISFSEVEVNSCLFNQASWGRLQKGTRGLTSTKKENKDRKWKLNNNILTSLLQNIHIFLTLKIFRY